MEKEKEKNAKQKSNVIIVTHIVRMFEGLRRQMSFTIRKRRTIGDADIGQSVRRQHRRSRSGVGTADIGRSGRRRRRRGGRPHGEQRDEHEEADGNDERTIGEPTFRDRLQRR